MFRPLSVYVGLRYARARSHRFFVSFITWVSLLGVAVGVASLIVILSVMNGFESELRDRLLSLTAPVRMQGAPEAAPDWAATQRHAAAQPGVTRVTRHAELQVLAVRQPEMLPLLLRGVDLETDAQIAELVVDREPGLRNLGDGVMLGQLVAQQLGVAMGDSITLLVPVITEGGVPDAKLRELRVVAIFEAGIQDHDATLAFASLGTLADLGAGRAGTVGLDLQVMDSMQAPRIAAALRQSLAAAGLDGIEVRDWTQDHASYFRAIRIEKTMMALILLLVVAVAAFNIVAMLVMVVADKRTDIAILRTLGAGPKRVASIFIAQGAIVGFAGVAAGVLLGVGLASNVDHVLGLLERWFGITLFDADVYVVTTVPSEVHGIDVMLIAGCALLLTLLATLYPARRAASVPPAEALRYE
jgi:lipoprotein-releasing system permease protein